MITKKYLENMILANNILIELAEEKLKGIKEGTINFNGTHAELMSLKNGNILKIKKLRIENSQAQRILERDFN